MYQHITLEQLTISSLIFIIITLLLIIFKEIIKTEQLIKSLELKKNKDLNNLSECKMKIEELKNNFENIFRNIELKNEEINNKFTNNIPDIEILKINPEIFSSWKTEMKNYAKIFDENFNKEINEMLNEKTQMYTDNLTHVGNNILKSNENVVKSLNNMNKLDLEIVRDTLTKTLNDLLEVQTQLSCEFSLESLSLTTTLLFVISKFACKKTILKTLELSNIKFPTVINDIKADFYLNSKIIYKDTIIELVKKENIVLWNEISNLKIIKKIV